MNTAIVALRDTLAGRICRLFGRIARRSLILAVPVSVITAACLLVPAMSGMSAGRQELLILAPYLVTALGIFLSIHFHRGRPVMVLLLLIIFYAGTKQYLPGGGAGPVRPELYRAVVPLIPVNIALIALMRERSIMSRGGRVRMLFLTVQAVLVFWFVRQGIYPASQAHGFPITFLPTVAPNLVTQPALITGVMACAVTAILTLRRQSPVDAGLLGALIAFCIDCVWIATPHVHTVVTTAGVLILTLAVVRDSYNMAFRDEMTNLLSRRSLNENLGMLGRRYAIAMLDLDHFKRINDCYGHETGDQVLKMVAGKMKDIGCNAKLYRYGGEEFTILFPGRGVKEVMPELERLRQTIADYHLYLRGTRRPASDQDGMRLRGTRADTLSLSITISIGVAERRDDLAAPEDVLQAADKALYISKKMGRNRVTSFQC